MRVRLSVHACAAVCAKQGTIKVWTNFGACGYGNTGLTAFQAQHGLANA